MTPNREDIIRMAEQVQAEGYAPVVIWPEVRRLCELSYAAGAAAEREAKDELLAALQDLLMDTQHSEHSCGDKNCPVAHAKAVALKYDAIRARGQA